MRWRAAASFRGAAFAGFRSFSALIGRRDAVRADVSKVLRNSPFKDIRDRAMAAFPPRGRLDPKKLPSPAVMATQGSVLTNKYAEGYPGRRYYGGCEFVDVAERLAIDRVLKLFGGDRANVQPHSFPYTAMPSGIIRSISADPFQSRSCRP